MAVTQNTPFASSVGNGVTTVFPYAFLLLSESDLVVTFDGVTQVSGFTVAGVGNPSGGNVTFTTPPASGVVVTLARILPLARSIDYQDAGDLLAATLNGDFDRLWLALQQLQQNDLRALKLRFEETVDQVIPGTPAERAGQYIGFDATGARVTLLAGTPGSVAVTPYMQTVLAAINAAEARTTLGAAALTSPAFTGTPTSTTPSAGDNSTRVATTAYVRGEIAPLTPTGTVSLYAGLTAPTGWVRLRATSIGNAASGATERANADTQALFELIWNSMTNTVAPVQNSAGTPVARGGSAAADYAANRRIVLPDVRAEFPRFLDDSRGVDTGRVVGSAQAQDIQAHTHSASTGSGGTFIYGNSVGGSANPSGTSGSTGGTETRPRNIAFLGIIKL